MDEPTASIFATALAFKAELLSGNMQVIVQLARDQRLRNSKGELVGDLALAEATTHAERLEVMLLGQPSTDGRMGSPSANLCGALSTMDFNLLPGDRGTDRWGPADLHVASASLEEGSAFALTLNGLPPEMLLHFKDGRYRISGPSSPPPSDSLAIIGESHSLQTALLVAKNKSERGVFKAMRL